MDPQLEIKTKIQQDSNIFLKLFRLFPNEKIRDNLVCRIRDANGQDIQEFMNELFQRNPEYKTPDARKFIADFIVYFLNIDCRIYQDGVVTYWDINSGAQILDLANAPIRPPETRNWIYTQMYEHKKPLLKSFHRAMGGPPKTTKKSALEVIEEFFDWLPVDADSMIKFFCGHDTKCHFPKTNEVVDAICPLKIADPLRSDDLLKKLLIKTKQFFRGFYVGTVRFVWRTIEGVFHWKATLKGLGTLIYKVCTLDGQYFVDAFNQLYEYAKNEPVAFWTEVLWNAALIAITVSASSGAFSGTIAQKAKESVDLAKLASSIPPAPSVVSPPPVPHSAVMKACVLHPPSFSTPSPPLLPHSVVVNAAFLPPAPTVSISNASQLAVYQTVAVNSKPIQLAQQAISSAKLNASIPSVPAVLPPATLTIASSIQTAILPTVLAATTDIDKTVELSPITEMTSEEQFEECLVEFVNKYRKTLNAVCSDAMDFHDMLLAETMFNFYMDKSLD